FIGIASLLALSGLIYFFPPTLSIGFNLISSSISFPLEKFLQIPILIVFFALLSLSIFSISTYSFTSKIHGGLITGFIVVYLIFRLSHLTNLFFLILLLALFITLELFFSNRRD